MYDATATVTGLRVEKTSGAGISITYSGVDLSAVVIDGVSTGNVIVRDGMTNPTDGLADGIIAGRGGTRMVMLDHLWITNAARAGILFSNAGGSVDASFAAMDSYGLVTEGTPVPTVGTDNELSGSTAAVLMNGTLSAPP